MVNFVSTFTRDNTTRRGNWRFPDAPVVCAGIDERDFPVITRPEPPWEWRLLYVGRLDATKGLETLLTAFARLPANSTLTVLGRGNHGYQRALRSLAAELGVVDRVTFSSTPRAELASHYQRADAVVFPSEWEEPFGLVPLEAMACGVPVVTTVRGGSGEFLRPDSNCVVFSPGDPAGLAEAVSRVANDGELRSRIVEQGYTTAGTFTIQHYAAALLPLHEGARRLPKSAPE
jgi:glycogen(starch) synthase